MAAQRDAPPDVLWRPQPNSAVQILLDEAREQAEAAGVTVECLAWTRPARSPPEPVVDRPGELPFLSLVLPPVGSKGAIRKRSTGGSFVRTPRLLARRHEGPSPDGQYAKSLESAAVKDFSLLRGPRGLRPGRTYEVPLVKVRRWRRRTLSASGRSRRVESRPRPAEARPGRLPLPRGWGSAPGSALAAPFVESESTASLKSAIPFGAKEKPGRAFLLGDIQPCPTRRRRPRLRP